VARAHAREAYEGVEHAVDPVERSQRVNGGAAKRHLAARWHVGKAGQAAARLVGQRDVANRAELARQGHELLGRAVGGQGHELDLAGVFAHDVDGLAPNRAGRPQKRHAQRRGTHEAQAGCRNNAARPPDLTSRPRDDARIGGIH